MNFKYNFKFYHAFYQIHARMEERVPMIIKEAIVVHAKVVTRDRIVNYLVKKKVF